MTTEINPSELQALVERIRSSTDTVPCAHECLLCIVDEIADDIGSLNLRDICLALAAEGRGWRGYPPDLPLKCDVLVRADGTLATVWAFSAEGDGDETMSDAMPCTLGDVLDACTGKHLVPPWFPLDWAKVYDIPGDRWLPQRRVQFEAH